MTAKFYKNRIDNFEKFEIFIERSGEEKKTKKRHDCITSRKFFGLLKTIFNKNAASFDPFHN